ncbi:hypothetical protein GLOIN_2v1790829 [Rhizophagus irregularis DAOM 181602=DAOM 197198]|nr:hypothetical protein GLOIN_2v1790829 [Rhizophagus irregularis DAOM 181602=DAOM 197198]
MFRKRNTLQNSLTSLWQQIYEPAGKFKEVMEATIEKVTMEEWNNTVKELNKNLTAGLSGINYKIILQLPEELVILLGYNCCGLPRECTNEPIHLVNNFIEDARENKKELWVLTQDMKKAFNSVGFLRIATAYGLSDGFIGNDGIDQGDALSPLLWRIFYDPLLVGIQQTKDSGYEMKVTWPNDINDPTMDTLQASGSVDIANDFYLINDIDINVKKSEMIIINPSVKRHDQIIKLGHDRSIVQATNNEIRYLGVWFSNKPSRRRWMQRLSMMVKNFCDTVRRKFVPAGQCIYLINRVLISRLIYIAQIMTLSEHGWNQVFAPVMKLIIS